MKDVDRPPPYQPYASAPVKKSSNVLLWVILAIVLVVIIVPCISMVGLGYWVFKAVGPAAGCAISFEGVHDALKAYANDHKGMAPPADKWQDELRSYYREEISGAEEAPFSIFKPDGEWSCETNGKKTGIALNADIAGKEFEKLPGNTVALFEVPTVGTNQSFPYKPQDPKLAPKRFGGSWLVVDTDGDMRGMGDGSGSKSKKRSIDWE